MRLRLRFAIATIAAILASPLSGVGSPSPDAPADVYFGAQKMSPLSVREKIDALGRAYDRRWISDVDLLHDAGIVSDALDAWRAKFPHDVWMAPTTFHLSQLYGEIQTPEARARALALTQQVADRYGSTKYGHLARLRITQGFPALHSETPVVPTPAPYASAAASGAPSDATSPLPLASPATDGSAPPAASTTPSAAGSPFASASPAAPGSPAASASPAAPASPAAKPA